MSTIKDVAKLAGVSVSATSYALNNTGPVSEPTKEKILKAAETLGYVPSGVARSLKNRRMGFVGYFTYSLTGPVFNEIARGIEDVFNGYGQEMVMCNCTPKANKVTKLLTEKMVDGAIIMDDYIEDNLIKRLANEDFPIVVLDRELHTENISSIVIDNETAVYNAIRYLLNLGYKTIGYIGGTTVGFDGLHREEGFKSAVVDFNLKVPKEWNITANFKEHEAYKETLNLIRKNNLPDAFFAANDEMAIGCIKALQQNGYNVPEDVAVIGFDDIQIGQYITPKLTTIKRPMYDLGVLAAHTLYGMINGNIESKKMMLTTELVIRESCGNRK